MITILVKCTSESDIHSYEATKAVAKKAQKKKMHRFQRDSIQDVYDTRAMLYQLSYKASLEAGQERVQFIPIIWIMIQKPKHTSGDKNGSFTATLYFTNTPTVGHIISVTYMYTVVSMSQGKITKFHKITTYNRQLNRIYA